MPPNNGKGKLPSFFGNGERVIPIYDQGYSEDDNTFPWWLQRKFIGGSYGWVIQVHRVSSIMYLSIQNPSAPTCTPSMRKIENINRSKLWSGQQWSNHITDWDSEVVGEQVSVIGIAKYSVFVPPFSSVPYGIIVVPIKRWNG